MLLLLSGGGDAPAPPVAGNGGTSSQLLWLGVGIIRMLVLGLIVVMG